MYILTFYVLIGIPFLGLLFVLDMLIKRSQRKEIEYRPRGFEVKLTTGEPPVPQKNK